MSNVCHVLVWKGSLHCFCLCETSGKPVRHGITYKTPLGYGQFVSLHSGPCLILHWGNYSSSVSLPMLTWPPAQHITVYFCLNFTQDRAYALVGLLLPNPSSSSQEVSTIISLSPLCSGNMKIYTVYTHTFWLSLIFFYFKLKGLF